MSIEPLRPQSSKTRLLLDEAVATREEYNAYLRGVLIGERPADPEMKEMLLQRCQQALQAWREAHDAQAARATSGSRRAREAAAL
jgi:hypothetical protein